MSKGNWRERAERDRLDDERRSLERQEKIEAIRTHDAIYTDVIEALEKLGIDGRRLNEYLAGLSESDEHGY